MKEWYYYLRDDKNRPVITVCIIENDGKYYRGISICSDKDQVIKRAGRNRSRGRALKAIHSTDDCEPIKRDEATIVFKHTSLVEGRDKYTDFPEYKVCPSTNLTSFEQKLIKVRRPIEVE